MNIKIKNLVFLAMNISLKENMSKTNLNLLVQIMNSYFIFHTTKCK